MKVTVINPEVVVKRMFFLAYQASEVIGRGWLQAKSNITEEDVWNNINTGGCGADYCDVTNISMQNQSGRIHADYVFGKMMKLSIEWDTENIILPDSQYDNPHPDYQSWCTTYKTHKELFEAAVESLK